MMKIYQQINSLEPKSVKRDLLANESGPGDGWILIFISFNEVAPIRTQSMQRIIDENIIAFA